MTFLQPARRPHARDIACLTSLRFFAAFWVLSLHYTDLVPYGFVAQTSFFDQGKLGVDFFFVLSGFILTHVYWRGLRDGRFGFARFMQKRFARLYPLHLVTFLAVVAYVVAGRALGLGFSVPEAYSLSGVAPNLLLVHAWGFADRLTWNYVSWSISAEWFAYLLFLPLSLLVLRLPGGPRAKILAAIAFLLVMALVAPGLIGRPLTHLTHDFGIARILPEFLLGIALYHLSRRYDLSPRAALPFVLGSLVLLALIAHFRAADTLAVLLLAGLIFAAASLERQQRAQWLAHPMLIYLGEISYSLYMTHAIVFIVYFKAAKLALGDAYDAYLFLVGPPALILCIATAALSYHSVEMPGRRLLGRPLVLLGAARQASPRRT